MRKLKNNEHQKTVLALPQKSKTMVVASITAQGIAIYSLAGQHGGSAWLLLEAFIISGFVTDWISGIAHFSFDYVWSPTTPILGPLAVEFQQHHEQPTLDPSNVVENLSKGAYVALPVALAAWLMSRLWSGTSASFLMVSILVEASIWIIGFHQIHSYAHMGAHISPAEFNEAVANITRLPYDQQEVEFAELFTGAGIPRFVKLFQRCRIFIRPEVHWRHHVCFERDFSSINGWSDWMMNPLYQSFAQRKNN